MTSFVCPTSCVMQGKMESKDSFEEAKGEGKRCDEKGYDDDDWDDRGKEADSDEEVSSNDV